MSKDRPIKSFRLDGERPFKTYSLGISSLFADSRRFENQQISLSGGASSIMQQHHQLHLRQHQQNPVSSQLNQRLQVAFNDPSEYLRLRAQFQLGYQNSMPIPAHINYDYDDVSLDSPGNHLTRSDLAASSESSSYSGGLDLNVSNTTTPDRDLQNFFEPKGSSYRAASNASLGDQDMLSMLFEHPLPFLNSGLPRSMDNATFTNYSSLTNGQLSEGLSLQFNNTAAQASEISRHVRGLVFSENSDNLPAKQEFNEGDFIASENQSYSIISSEQSRDNCHESLKYNPDFSAASVPSEGQSTVNSTDKVITRDDYHSDSNDRSQGEASKYQTYMEKRKKNNESAKRSREARRTKEELVALRVIGLEEENMKLQAEICMLDRELDELRTQLYQCN